MTQSLALTLAPCPCGRPNPEVEVEDEYSYVRCVCGWRGPNVYDESDDAGGRSRTLAIAAWNRRPELAASADAGPLAEAVAWLKSGECNVGPRSEKAIATVLAALSRPAQGSGG